MFYSSLTGMRSECSELLHWVAWLPQMKKTLGFMTRQLLTRWSLYLPVMSNPDPDILRWFTWSLSRLSSCLVWWRLMKKMNDGRLKVLESFAKIVYAVLSTLLTNNYVTLNIKQHFFFFFPSNNISFHFRFQVTFIKTHLTALYRTLALFLSVSLKQKWNSPYRWEDRKKNTLKYG